MKKIYMVVFAISAFLCISPAQADSMSAVDFIQKYDSASAPDKGVLSVYLNGVINGFLWANTMLGTMDREKLYCLKPQLSPEQGVVMIKAIVKDRPNLKDYPFEALLLVALREGFPCGKN